MIMVPWIGRIRIYISCVILEVGNNYLVFSLLSSLPWQRSCKLGFSVLVAAVGMEARGVTSEPTPSGC
jgi:hypothetical protein